MTCRNTARESRRLRRQGHIPAPQNEATRNQCYSPTAILWTGPAATLYRRRIQPQQQRTAAQPRPGGGFAPPPSAEAGTPRTPRRGKVTYRHVTRVTTLSRGHARNSMAPSALRSPAEWCNTCNIGVEGGHVTWVTGEDDSDSAGAEIQRPLVRLPATLHRRRLLPHSNGYRNHVGSGGPALRRSAQPPCSALADAGTPRSPRQRVAQSTETVSSSLTPSGTEAGG